MNIFKKIIEKIYLSFKDNLVIVDALTGVFNKNFILYDKHIEKYQGYVTLIDLNSFKEINDKYGHQYGDQVLIAAANTLKNYGLVIRYGGDEFIVLSKEPIGIIGDLYSVGCVFKTKYDSFNETLELADDKMYQFKQNYYRNTGRNRRRV